MKYLPIVFLFVAGCATGVDTAEAVDAGVDAGPPMFAPAPPPPKASADYQATGDDVEPVSNKPPGPSTPNYSTHAH